MVEFSGALAPGLRSSRAPSRVARRWRHSRPRWLARRPRPRGSRRRRSAAPVVPAATRGAGLPGGVREDARPGGV